MKPCLAIAGCAFLLMPACHSNHVEADASGTFESVEVIVSAEATGMIRKLEIEEGQVLREGDTIGYIDTTQLWLRKRQLLAQAEALLGRKPDIPVQLAALQEQRSHAVRDQQRIAELIKADAATRKQLDDATTQIEVIDRQIRAQQSTLEISATGLQKEVAPLLIQVMQINDQISKSLIVNHVPGTVLLKYAEAHEMATPGKPLYKIADLTTLTLRAYITGNQLKDIKIGQQVKVLMDGEGNKGTPYEGVIEWVSDKAEFTPKTIQTLEERANLVYAVKVRVANDGYLKIGMYGDIQF